MNADVTVSIIRINPDVENEDTPSILEFAKLIHFQPSARSAKKSNDFFGLILANVIGHLSTRL
jgi:hypothetical protein